MRNVGGALRETLIAGSGYLSSVAQVIIDSWVMCGIVEKERKWENGMV